MLDEHSFEAKQIFQASVYIDRLRFLCYSYVLLDFEERQPLFEEMIATAHELLDFSETAFPESYERINDLTEGLLKEINKLQIIHAATGEGRCKVCNSELECITTHYQGRMTNVSFCRNCSRPLILIISELERPTGVWAI